MFATKHLQYICIAFVIMPKIASLAYSTKCDFNWRNSI